MAHNSRLGLPPRTPAKGSRQVFPPSRTLPYKSHSGLAGPNREVLGGSNPQAPVSDTPSRKAPIQVYKSAMLCSRLWVPPVSGLASLKSRQLIYIVRDAGHAPPVFNLGPIIWPCKTEVDTLQWWLIGERLSKNTSTKLNYKWLLNNVLLPKTPQSLGLVAESIPPWPTGSWHHLPPKKYELCENLETLFKWPVRAELWYRKVSNNHSIHVQYV